MATTDARTGFRLPWSSDQRSPSDGGASAPADLPAGEAGDVSPGDAPVNAAVDSVTGQATDWKDEMTPTAALSTSTRRTMNSPSSTDARDGERHADDGVERGFPLPTGGSSTLER